MASPLCSQLPDMDPDQYYCDKQDLPHNITDCDVAIHQVWKLRVVGTDQWDCGGGGGNTEK